MATTRVTVRFSALKKMLDDKANLLHLLGDTRHRQVAKALQQLRATIHKDACGGGMAQVFTLEGAAALKKFKSARSKFKSQVSTASRKKR